eukprot:Gb_21520 [translate_table: standard]
MKQPCRGSRFRCLTLLITWTSCLKSVSPLFVESLNRLTAIWDPSPKTPLYTVLNPPSPITLEAEKCSVHALISDKLKKASPVLEFTLSLIKSIALRSNFIRLDPLRPYNLRHLKNP